MKTLQIYGPFYTNYSLARVNRGLGLALSKIQQEYKVSFYCDPDKIDWWPSESDLNKKPEIKELFNTEKVETDIVIYNNFPKTLTDLHGLAELPGRVKLMYTAWEDSSYPKFWVEEINNNLHGLMTASTFTKNVLRKSGVKIPIQVVLNALDETVKQEAEGTYPLKTTKKFKFFHNSTAKQRKGVDLLLKAYFEEFTNTDDVVLVIKSFPGPDNMVETLLNELKSENSPEVIHINNPDLSEEDIRNLTAECDCGVYPTRGEGFGLPILECMYHRLPVITTSYSGQLDFCTDENCYLLDYKLQNAKNSEIVNIEAKWAEPDFNQLKKYMREVFDVRNSNSSYDKANEDKSQENFVKLNAKIKLAKEAADYISWENSANAAMDFIKQVEKTVVLKQKTIGVLSFINNESGISVYSQDLYSKIENSFESFYYLGNKDVSDRSEEDSDNVIRCWTTGEENFAELLEVVKKNNLDIVHIQYHSGSYFSIEALDKLIVALKYLNVEVIVTLHAVRGNGFDFVKESINLKSADKIIIHNQNDFDYAKESLKNVYLMEHPRVEFPTRSRASVRKELGLTEFYPIISTHGLLNTNKGVKEIIQAVAELKKKYPQVLFLGINAVSSNNIYSQGLLEELRTEVEQLGLTNNIVMVTDFLDLKYVQLFMQASDVIVFAYIDTAGESASGAVGKGLASKNPVIVTDINMFNEFTTEVYKIKDNSAESISSGIETVLKDKDLAGKLVNSAKTYIAKTNFDVKALETLGLY